MCYSLALWQRKFTMDIEESRSASPMLVDREIEQSNRWSHLGKLLNRNGPLAHPDFQRGPQMLQFLSESVRILVVGAGGLGCELLKDLALCGFQNIDIIDMDTIDISNLNRQFLFRSKDIGKAKADVAAEFINNRVKGCCVKPHFCKIQDMDDEFYQGFHIIVCGLDSVVARRWINGMLVSLLDYDKDENVDPSTIIPMVDGGTEAFKGNARVIIPGVTACIECTLDLFPPQVNYPMCTIASTPRLPEHCIEYAKVFQWPEEKPFGDAELVDGDNPNHIKWIYDKALERSKEYNIKGVTYRLTQGVVKHIIPAVASTNAVIAAACALEVFKIATYCCNPLNNYMVFNDSDGLYTYTFEAEKKDDCCACGRVPQKLTFSDDDTLQTLLDYLIENQMFQMKAPGITTSINGKNKTLYMQFMKLNIEDKLIKMSHKLPHISSVPSIEEMTRPNLEKKLKDLGITEGHEIAVADSTSPKPIIFRIYYETKMDQREILV